MKKPPFRIRLHIHVGEAHSLGPGKAALLEAIRDTGSISAAARSLRMAYRHAWELVDDLNAGFRSAVVETASGGRVGGGAQLTAFGTELVARFRAMERATERAVARDLARLAPRLGRPAAAKRHARARPAARKRATNRTRRSASRP